ncbi:MAG: alpha/beta fold hydrolase [Bacteroidota bacterium]
MPLITASTYRAPWLFRAAHVNTIIPALFRRVFPVPLERMRITTPDNDFLDVDLAQRGNRRLVITLHGLEGSSERPYIMGMLRYFYEQQWDVAGMNFRSCSGAINRRLRTYNMGESSDLGKVVQHFVTHFDYDTIVLIGFSLGGNVVLKYLGESGRYLPETVRASIAISVPCHLLTASQAISAPRNWMYVRRFLGTLNVKMQQKANAYPQYLALPEQLPKNFTEFDGQFTGPIHGYEHEIDYYSSCASTDFMANIHCPTLLLNAQDDTFLSPACFPRELAEQHAYLYLEMPRHGGHCGFYGPDARGTYWTERRSEAFLAEVLV